ncbi:hypothetical protein GCM10023257_11280 [Streptomyces hyderabadensis]|uniref:Uncharacterized protein n=1 Tax=Streptomyces hyderabadensis TaxID=598549 RepID=A0ABP9HQY5_9ACTN
MRVSVLAEASPARVRAAEADDVYAAGAAQDEVDDAVRAARDHGLVPQAAEGEER